METIAGFPVHSIEFNKEGFPAYPKQVQGLIDAMAATAVRCSNLLVLSHGWNNDMSEANAAYRALLSNLRTALQGTQRNEVCVLAVFWPSKRFADEDLIPAVGEPRLGSSSAAGGGLGDEVVKRRLEQLTDVFDHGDEESITELSRLVDRLEGSPEAQRKFVHRLRSLVSSSERAMHEDDGSQAFLERPGDALFGGLCAPIVVAERGSHGGIAAIGPGGKHADEAESKGATAGLGSAFSGIQAAAWRLLNFTTYYQMKNRAGLIGRGLNGILAKIRAVRPDLRIHLAGHSFGARVVTAAVDGPAPFKPVTLALLQGAYSHHGLTSKFDGKSDGIFHAVVSQQKVAGRIVITHTGRDKAVGVAYAIASRLSGDNRRALGDASDPFGGIGRNGAIGLPPDKVVALNLLAPNSPYQLPRGKVINLLADEFISGHGDVTNPAVAWLIGSAMASLP